MIGMLVEVARKKIYEYNPGAAIKLVMDCLEGCTKEQAFKIITGEYQLVMVEGGVDIEEATPDFDIQEWADDSVTCLEDQGEKLMEDLKAVMKQIISKGKIDMAEISYNSLFNYYFNNDPSGIVEDVETTSKLPDLIRRLCLDCRKFLEDCHEMFIAFSYLKNNHDLEVDPGKVILICSEMNKFVQELCTDSNAEVNQLYARHQYMEAELDKYIKEGKTIEELRKKNVIHPIDITSDTDAGWLSPEGDYYGLKGAVANFLHIQIADLLQMTRRIPTVEDMKADAWMSQNGWVKIHHDEVYYDGYYQSQHGYPMVPLTDIQKNRIAQYGKALYNGVLKFGVSKQECRVSKFQQMDEFAIRKLFDFQ